MGKYTTKQIKNALGKLDEGWALDRQALLFDSALEPIYRIEDGGGNGYTQIHLMFDYQLDRHCSKTEFTEVEGYDPFDYQLDRHCSKTHTCLW